MKKLQIKNIGLLSIIIIFLSCDPSHSIEIINNGNSDLKVKFEIDSKNESHDLYYLEGRNEDSIVYNLKNNDTIRMDFGIGTWSDNEIQIQAKSFKSIEFENNDLKKVFKSKESIENLFKENRKSGIFGNGFSIEIIILEK